MRTTKASNLQRPEIIIKRINFNERLEQEVNSLAIENEPYCCYKFLSPKIIPNKDCIKVKGKSID
jgi:hypothetical protein